MLEGLVYLVASFWLGAVHAATPGHGKTIAASYIIGARGRPVDAIALGIFVTLSHTSGIIIVAALATLGSAWLVPQRVEAYLAVVTGVLVVGIGAWMLRTQFVPAPSAAGRHAPAHSHDGAHDHSHERGAAKHEHGEPAHDHGDGDAARGLGAHQHVHAHGDWTHVHEHGDQEHAHQGNDQQHAHGAGEHVQAHGDVMSAASSGDQGHGVHEHQHVHGDMTHAHTHGDVTHAHASGDQGPGVHEHGPGDVMHSHAHGAVVHRHGWGPAHTHDLESITRGRPSLGMLLGLGIAGGLLPDPGALAILLSAIAGGRLILGLSTVLVFSLGFASVLVIVGVVAARVGKVILAWLESRWVYRVQIAAALLIVGIGVILTVNGLRAVAALA